MEEPIYLEDLTVGDVFLSDHYTLDAEQIVRYAREFDPQPFHLDHEAAKDTFFQGLAASGWQTAGITMRLLVASLPLARGIIGAGAEMAWPQATRPGDVLRVTSTILSITPSRSKPDRGIVVVECITSNQRSEILQRMVTKILCFKK
ncbi:MaoC family dehydratase [Pseudomonas sichuanensis]|uniref:MaoC family dehydratase n=1 Tax=Pseudomonas sichuanensis TaxID=2213015 RepID=UPI00244A6F34|nr:MaoC family dehydratase [Pseudomonas sichuanensis]MDH0733664.1 MaoC family dehydratase [Pseudomonas sichuanensis]MDH1585704.1 MaoC family dehydratase [Pseudomonas sichuanensis]MDH1595213.1 MaoC family dehydratase [Pseudomonas sichuanensis]MDH1598205.1 MaoC family dehydratase [Pseudomonas sichuanensis]